MRQVSKGEKPAAAETSEAASAADASMQVSLERGTHLCFPMLQQLLMRQESFKSNAGWEQPAVLAH